MTRAGVPSPRRVRICLLEKRLPFTVKWLNLGLMDQKRPDYLDAQSDRPGADAGA